MGKGNLFSITLRTTTDMEKSLRIITQRTTLKLSTDLTQDEMRQAIANAIGRPIEEIPHFDQASELAEIRRQSERVNEIIKEHKLLFDSDPKTTRDKYEELHDIGKFILAAGDLLTIRVPEEMTAFPDFMLAQENYKIGIEHTRLMTGEMKAIVKTVKYCIEKANHLLADELNYLSKTINIFVDLNREVIGGSSFKDKGFSATQREKIPQIIAEYIKSELTGGNITKPPFITQVEITSNKDSRVDLELAERYFTQEDFVEQLTSRIEKKERRAHDYRSVSKCDRLWLLIVIDDVSSFSGFGIETARLPVIARSNFDSIFIFEKFGCRIIQIFDRP